MKIPLKRIFSDREIPDLKELWDSYIYRVIIRVLWPIVPICMEIFIRFLIKKAIVFPNQTILVLAFIVPASYLADYKSEISINIISMLCLFSTAPFFCSIVSNSLLIYWVGFILFIFFIVLFIILDFFATLKKHSIFIEQR